MLLLQARKKEDESEDDAHATKTAIASQEIAEDLRAEREDQAPINQLADRLFRVVVFGLRFWPLQFYALILLWQFSQESGTVSPDRRWKVGASFLFAPIIAVLTCLGICALSRP